MSHPYTVGVTVRVTGTFRNASDALADPSTVTFKHRAPRERTATTVTYAGGGVIKSSTGVYYVDLTASTNGKWWFRWESTGTPATADEDYFEVSDSQFD
jgi:hypothetical protein